MTAERPDPHRATVVRSADLRPGQPTPGMIREEAVATGSLWAGLLHTEPGMVSGWHHHGTHESAIYVISGRLRMESGPGGSDVLDAEAGDFVYVPSQAVHRESNPSAEKAVALVVRAGKGEVVVNVEGPDSSA
jgi:uncharacterized RmlC-like cupin family protein